MGHVRCAVRKLYRSLDEKALLPENRLGDSITVPYPSSPPASARRQPDRLSTGPQFVIVYTALFLSITTPACSWADAMSLVTVFLSRAVNALTFTSVAGVVASMAPSTSSILRRSSFGYRGTWVIEALARQGSANYSGSQPDLSDEFSR